MTPEVEIELKAKPETWNGDYMVAKLTEVRQALTTLAKVQQAPNCLDLNEEEKKLFNLPVEENIFWEVVAAWLKFRIDNNVEEKDEALTAIEERFEGEFKKMSESGQLGEIRDMIVPKIQRKGF
jgi:hypothetical protein